MRLITSIIWLASAFIWTVNTIEEPSNWINYTMTIGSFVCCFIWAKNFDRQLRK